MKRHRVLVALAALALLFSAATAAEATCYKEGYLVFIGGTKVDGAARFGVKTSLGDSVRWDFFSKSTQTWMLPTLSAGMYSSGAVKRVKIQGDAASCPTSGATRSGGYINYFYVVYP